MNILLNSFRCARRYGLIGGLCALIVCGGQDAAGAPLADAPSGPVRLAVLADDTLDGTRAFTDLLTIELEKVPGVEIVERGEIERVLAEQSLVADGLVEAANRVQLGRILGAAGLVFVQRETGGDRFLVRLTETRRGFIAGFFMAPAAGRTQPAAIAAELGGFLPKLALDLSQQTTVSLFRFTTAMLPSPESPHPSEERFESLMVMLLMERLCREPDIVVTERRRLGDLAQEEKLSGEEADLTSGALVVDGEVATAVQRLTPAGDDAVTLTVRIRDLTSGTITPVVVTGARKKLDPLIAAAVAATGDALQKDRRAKREDEPQQDETASLLILARQKGLVWAGEAAYALNPKDKSIQKAYLKALIDEGDVEINRDAAPRDAYLKVALALARAEQVAREQGASLWSFAGNSLSALRHNLEQRITHSDREIVQLLRPFRATMRRECEAAAQRQKQPTRKGAGYAGLVEWSAALYETAEERQAFINALLDRAATDTAWEESMRDYLIGYLLTQHNWPAQILAKCGADTDPVRRFYGQYGLMRKTFDPQQQRVHSREALNALEGLLQRSGALGSYWIIPRVSMTSNRWLSSALLEICARYPDYETEVKRHLFVRMRELHAAGDQQSLYLLEPTIHLRGLPREEVVPWLDEVSTARADAPPPEYLIGEMFKALNTLRQEKWEVPPQLVRPAPATARFQRHVLLQNGSAGTAWRLGGGGTHGDTLGSHMFGPQRLLVDGDTLWIGLAGARGREDKRITYACGLAQFHLPTRQLRAARSGWMKTPFSQDGTRLNQITRGKSSYYCPLQPLGRWRNWIVVVHANAGIALFPVDPSSSASDLSGVTLLNSDTGLPSNEVYGWASLENTLYIRIVDQFVMTWNDDTRKMALLFDNMRQITEVAMPEHDKFSVHDLWVDEATQRLYIPGQLWLRSGVQSWHSPQEGTGCLSYHPVSTQWTYTQQVPTRIAAEPDLLVLARQALQADGIEDILDVAVWKGKILALIGYGEAWKLELLTEK